jgi:hypothetical protein
MLLNTKRYFVELHGTCIEANPLLIAQIVLSIPTLPCNIDRFGMLYGLYKCPSMNFFQNIIDYDIGPIDSYS